jgi:hypothetical protein
MKNWKCWMPILAPWVGMALGLLAMYMANKF